MFEQADQIKTLQRASARANHPEDALILWNSTATVLRLVAEGDIGFRSTKEVQLDAVRRNRMGEGERALRTAAEQLLELLFARPRLVARDEFGAGRGADARLGPRRLLIEFMRSSRLQELVAIVSSLREAADESGLSYDSRVVTELTEFLSTWLRDTSGDLLPDLDSPWGEPSTSDRFVDPVPATSSAHAAFHSWTSEFVQIRDNLAANSVIAPTVDRSNAALDTLERNADVAKATAAKVGDESLAKHFSTLATGEEIRARWWTFITALGVVVTILLGASVIAGWFADEDTEWASQLVHLALTLPAAAGTAYASTIGSRHRQQAWWAATLAAQLHTFDAFSAPLPEDARAHLRTEFGARMFTQPAFNTGAQKPDSAAITAPLTDILKRSSEPKQ